MTPTLLETIRAYARVDSAEVCGALIASSDNTASYFPCTNTAKSSEHCRFCPKDMARAEDTGFLIGYVHTHNDDSGPSEMDHIFCKRSRKPWWVVTSNSFTRINPMLPLSGRVFSWGVQDCYTLIKDWYSEQGIELPDFVRSKDFWKEGSNPYMDGLSEAGFELVNDEPRYSDVILMDIQSSNGIPNHGAVHIGDGQIIHHLPNRLSMVELYDGLYQSSTVAVARRKP